MEPRDRSLFQRTQVQALLACLCLASACQRMVIVGELPPPVPGDHSDPEASDRAADSGSSPLPPADAGQAGPTLVETGRPAPRTDQTGYAVSVESGPREMFCQQRGAALTSKRIGDEQADCESPLARRVFSYGMCACDELRIDSDTFLIDSFDSSAGAYQAGETGGNIAVSSSNLQLAKTTEVLGSVWVAGDGNLTLAHNLLIAFDLKANGPVLVSAGEQRVARDLWVASDVTVDQGKLLIDGDAYQAQGRSGLAAASVAGQIYASDYRVPAPCNCGAAAPIDVAVLVAQARDHNDNATASFAPDALATESLTTDFEVLPCGRLHAAAFTLSGPSTYFVWPDGRSALFIAGDLTVSQLSTLFLNSSTTTAPFFEPLPAPGELDVFIAGDLVIEMNASLVLGDSARPAATRLFLAGQIKAQGTLVLAAQLYAPNATYSAPMTAPDTDLYGSVFARAIQLNSKRFHYDRAILQTGETCTAGPPQRCAGCSECPDELACVAGSCGPCSSDADCCEPTGCSAGKCQLLVSDWPPP